ncbi:hypothetical protein P7C70_g1319, partial [Phenoliferia sp. Uapishka_3]
MGLTQLPPPILQRIVKYALEASDPAIVKRSLFGARSRQLTCATFEALVHDLALEDNDAILVQAEAEADSGPAAATTRLAAVITRPPLARAVAHLSVHPPPLSTLSAGRSSSTAPWEDASTALTEDADSDLASAPLPLEDLSFLLVLSKLPALTSFTWASNRLPPTTLCPALGTTARSLVAFTLDLAPSPSDAIRWDASQLSTLPTSLIRLSLSQLSIEGVRSLASAATASLPALEHLELTRTVFVDDALLEALPSLPSLRSLAIVDMHGTKLTDKGLAALMEGCNTLEVLELHRVEGKSPFAT